MGITSPAEYIQYCRYHGADIRADGHVGYLHLAVDSKLGSQVGKLVMIKQGCTVICLCGVNEYHGEWRYPPSGDAWWIKGELFPGGGWQHIKADDVESSDIPAVGAYCPAKSTRDLRQYALTSMEIRLGM